MLNTKNDYRQLLLEMINPVKGKYTEGCAGIMLGATSAVYEDKTIPMEAYARILWGLAPFFAGGGRESEFASIARRGLINGCDPESEEYWGVCRPFDQRFVEMAAIAYAVMLAPNELWNPLTQKQKENVADWLYQMNENEFCKNNWKFFGVLTNSAMKLKGMRYSQEKLDDYLNELDGYYLGDGWYEDGISHQKDYYISYAMHFYGLVYSVWMKDEDPKRCAEYRRRALIFGRDFIHWFSEDGAAVPFGRSQTYRFAQGAFWSACFYAGVEPYSVGVMKGILSRLLEYWREAPIYDNGGVLTIGYRYPNLHMSESYNAPGSPYWGLKTFAVLALEDDHPFWSEQALPMPEREFMSVQKKPGLIITHEPHNTVMYGSGKFYSEGHNHVECKYSKFAYSSEFGFSVSRENYFIEQAAPDSMLAFETDGNIYVRRNSSVSEVSDGSIYTEWSPITGITVKTTIIPKENGHIRRHTISADRDCKAYDCGFAVDCRDGRGFRSRENAHTSVCENDKSSCSVSSQNADGTRIISCNPNTSMMYQKTMIPAVFYNIKKGETITVESEVITEVR